MASVAAVTHTKQILFQFFINDLVLCQIAFCPFPYVGNPPGDNLRLQLELYKHVKKGSEYRKQKDRDQPGHLKAGILFFIQDPHCQESAYEYKCTVSVCLIPFVQPQIKPDESRDLQSRKQKKEGGTPKDQPQKPAFPLSLHVLHRFLHMFQDIPSLTGMSFVTQPAWLSSAWRRSSMMSFTFSIPTLSRIREGSTPASTSWLSESWRCVWLAGCRTHVLASAT